MLIPFAGGGAAVAQAPAWAQLRPVLARMSIEGADEGAAESLSPPHERVLARCRGLPVRDGLLPFAAWEARQAGEHARDEGWAWITPCHWRVGADHIWMAPPWELRLEEDESRALLAAMQPYFAEDGLTLAYEEPQRWRARGAWLRELPAASLDRVAGRVLDGWLPSGEGARPLRRLQQEMQMLLYTLPLNETRQARGLLPVNSFWVSGTGALPAGAPAPVEDVRVAEDLREPALRGDLAAWLQGWERIDAREGPLLAAQLAAGRPARITLCGERSARTWAAGGGNWLRRLATLFASPEPRALLEGL